jgi:hypothetical protein
MMDVWDALYVWERANDDTIGDCSLCGNDGIYSLHGAEWKPTGTYAFCDCHAATTMPPALRTALVATGKIVVGQAVLA